MIGDIKGEIVKRFMTRGKMVNIVMINTNDVMYAFRIIDKCNQKDYYNADRYATQIECERAAMKVCKGL